MSFLSDSWNRLKSESGKIADMYVTQLRSDVSALITKQPQNIQSSIMSAPTVQEIKKVETAKTINQNIYYILGAIAVIFIIGYFARK